MKTARQLGTSLEILAEFCIRGIQAKGEKGFEILEVIPNLEIRKRLRTTNGSLHKKKYNARQYDVVYLARQNGKIFSEFIEVKYTSSVVGMFREKQRIVSSYNGKKVIIYDPVDQVLTGYHYGDFRKGFLQTNGGFSKQITKKAMQNGVSLLGKSGFDKAFMHYGKPALEQFYGNMLGNKRQSYQIMMQSLPNVTEAAQMIDLRFHNVWKTVKYI
jgi:hypothetical protein